MKEIRKDVQFYFSIIKSKLFKKIRKAYNFTHIRKANKIFFKRE